MTHLGTTDAVASCRADEPIVITAMTNAICKQSWLHCRPSRNQSIYRGKVKRVCSGLPRI